MPYRKELARRVLDVIPPLMHRIRGEMRTEATSELSVQQFRILSNIRRGLCFTNEIAADQRVSLAAISRAIDVLVKRNLVARKPDRKDRRRVSLRLTKLGTTLFARFGNRAQTMLESRIKKLNGQEQLQLKLGLSQIEKLFVETPRLQQRRQK